MHSRQIYSTEDITRTYEKVHDHVAARNHILRYSENHNDIRDIALQALDLSDKLIALDLGCSYGFFTEKLAGSMHKGAYITGIDLVDRGCRELFLHTIINAGCTGRFIEAGADVIAGMKDSSFDVVAACYSLYFFPHLIGEISRILKPDGLFIAITHSEQSLREVIPFIPVKRARDTDELAISRLLRAFSMENAESKLKEHFDSIEKIPYANRLVFSLESIDECCDYLFKKRDLLFKEHMNSDPGQPGTTMDVFFMKIRDYVRKNRSLEITKNDCVFRCRNPKQLRGSP